MVCFATDLSHSTPDFLGVSAARLDDGQHSAGPLDDLITLTLGILWQWLHLCRISADRNRAFFKGPRQALVPAMATYGLLFIWRDWRIRFIRMDYNLRLLSGS